MRVVTWRTRASTRQRASVMYAREQARAGALQVTRKTLGPVHGLAAVEEAGVPR